MEPDWDEERRRLRSRANKTMAILICPIIMAVAGLKIVEPYNYAAGDIRNDPTFRLLFFGGAIVVLGMVMAWSVWSLLRSRS